MLVAGGTGVTGRRLTPQLVARAHEVTATTTRPPKPGLLEQLVTKGVVMNGLDRRQRGKRLPRPGRMQP
jgi:uncharacterized protein YbjT (DUF2867 family)